MRCDELRWDGMGCDGVGWDECSDAMSLEYDVVRWDELKWNGKG